jgi:hypothetical protein
MRMGSRTSTPAHIICEHVSMIASPHPQMQWSGTADQGLQNARGDTVDASRSSILEAARPRTSRANQAPSCAELRD